MPAAVMTSGVVRRAAVGAPETALATEWLLTNGLGGFALGTALGVNSRRYHGWLIAATSPPVGRVVALHSIVDEVVLPERVVELATFHFGDDLAPHPAGWRHLRAFEAEMPDRAQWTFADGALSITRTLRLTRGANEASVTYAISGAPSGARLRLRPLVPLRDFHALDHESGHGDVHRVREDAEGVHVTRGGYRVRLAADAALPGVWATDPQWWRDFAYAEERARGQDWREDVYAPGTLTFDIGPGPATVTLRATMEPRERGRKQAARWSAETPPARPVSGADRSPLVLAGSAADTIRRGARAGMASADQFVVRRDDATSIIAGYPWFADWGRDAMISLPGLLLTTGRFGEARSVLALFAGRLENGLLPNCFDDRGGRPLYNTADAGLWYIHALRSYALASGDEDLGPLLEAARAIVRAYRRGTGHGIALGADGLLVAGEGREPVTWMDARRGGITYTPREGKPVELSALWYNALLCLADMIERTNAKHAYDDEPAELRERAGHTALSLQIHFWWPERRCLHDVLRLGEHDWEGDGRLRPNQILAVSLPFSPLPHEQQVCVVDIVRERLLTPYGLRTLDPDDPEYRGRYEGDLMARDAAYHNGTVWPWLMGPYCDALMRVAGGSDPGGPDRARDQVQALLAPLLGEMDGGCLGHIAEVYDGDEPHRPSGCPAQAWSLAEVLRVSASPGIV